MMRRSRLEREVISRRADSERIAYVQRMHRGRAATRIGLKLDGDHVALGFARCATQRILPRQTWLEVYIDVRTGRICGQRATVSRSELERADIDRFLSNVRDADGKRHRRTGRFLKPLTIV